MLKAVMSDDRSHLFNAWLLKRLQPDRRHGLSEICSCTMCFGWMLSRMVIAQDGHCSGLGKPLVEPRTKPRLASRHTAEVPWEWWRILEKHGYLLRPRTPGAPLRALRRTLNCSSLGALDKPSLLSVAKRAG